MLVNFFAYKNILHGACIYVCIIHKKKHKTMAIKLKINEAVKLLKISKKQKYFFDDLEQETLRNNLKINGGGHECYISQYNRSYRTFHNLLNMLKNC